MPAITDDLPPDHDEFGDPLPPPKEFAVIAEPHGIVTSWHATYDEAVATARRMTLYHRRRHIAVYRRD